MAKRTVKQLQRQQHRDTGGRYSQVHPCYRCGRSAGLDYCSGPYVDRADATGRQWNDEMLCTCQPCADYLHGLTPQQLAAEVDGPRWGHLPQGKPAAGWTVELRRGPLAPRVWTGQTPEQAKKRAWALVELHGCQAVVDGTTIIVDAGRWYK